MTRDFLNRIIPAHQFYEIEIITGAGNHSTGHVAKIKVRSLMFRESRDYTSKVYFLLQALLHHPRMCLTVLGGRQPQMLGSSSRCVPLSQAGSEGV